MKKSALFLSLLLSTFSWGARNSTGTYSAPSGGSYPATAGTTISASAFNTLVADFIAEITSSLDRQGRGAMLAQLRCIGGDVLGPGLAIGESNTGLYLPTSGNLWFTVGGQNAAQFRNDGVGFFHGAVITTDGAGETGLVSTGNGGGWGAQFSGGSSGSGVAGTGVGGGNGGVFTGSNSASGSVNTGGSAGDGIRGSAGGVLGYGGQFFTSNSTNKVATVHHGMIRLYSSQAAPSSSLALGNVVTTENIINMKGCVSTNGSATPDITDDFNVGSVTVTSNDIVVTASGSGWTAVTGFRPVVSGPAVLNSQGTLWEASQGNTSSSTVVISAYGAGGSLTTKHNLAAAGTSGASVCFYVTRGLALGSAP